MEHSRGAKILLIGDSGSGKTWSIRTLIDAGITPYVIFTEPGLETLGDLPKESFHWRYIAPVAPGWEALTKMAENINRLSLEGLSNSASSNRSQHTQFLDVLESCNNFKCECCNKSWGDTTTWNTDRALVFDSLTGLSTQMNNLVTGNKPVKAMHEWQIIQNGLKHFLDKITTDLKCWLVVLGHLAREKDEVTGQTFVMVSSPGRALSPTIPINFSDVILTIRDGTDFTWSTGQPGVVTKARNVPVQANLPPSFVPLVEKWKSQGGIIQPTVGGSDV